MGRHGGSPLQAFICFTLVPTVSLGMPIEAKELFYKLCSHMQRGCWERENLKRESNKVKL